jgi:hypothetical protein
MCPYLDRRDARCAGLLTLTNLREAFRLCAGDHESCRTYHDIRVGDLRRERDFSDRLVAKSA